MGVVLAQALVSNLGSVPGMGQLGGLALPPQLAAGMFGFGAAIGLISGLAPAAGAYRANITAMLREV